MKSTTKWVASIALCTTLLAGCGVSQSGTGATGNQTTGTVASSAAASGGANNSVGSNATSGISTGNNTAGNTAAGNSTTVVATNTPASSTNHSGYAGTTSARPQQTELQMTVEGNVQKTKATLYKSSNQPFSMYVLNGYTASAEEPGKDVVLYKANSNMFMRVAVISKEANKTEVVNSIKESLKTLGGAVEPVQEPQLANQAVFKDAVIYHASNATTSRMVYLLTLNGTMVEVSLWLPPEAESTVPFVTMMKTLRLNAE